MTIAVSERIESYPYVFIQALAEHFSDVPALGVGRSETLCPTNEFAVIDTVLPVYPKTHVLGKANRFGNDDLRAWVRELEMFTSRWSASSRTRSGPRKVIRLVNDTK